MTDTSIAAVVLAAGKGTRMHSAKPKVLQTLLNEPMLHYVYCALDPIMQDNVLTVIGHAADMVREAFPEKCDSFVVQEEQLGTGHALQVLLAEVHCAVARTRLLVVRAPHVATRR